MLKANRPEWREISWERALTAASPNVASALEKALAGKDLCLEALRLAMLLTNAASIRDVILFPLLKHTP